jgi:hypothetical protein
MSAEWLECERFPRCAMYNEEMSWRAINAIRLPAEGINGGEDRRAARVGHIDRRNARRGDIESAPVIWAPASPWAEGAPRLATFDAPPRR